MLFRRIFFATIVCIVCITNFSRAQERVRIKIERADFLRHDDKIGKNTQSLNGSVVLSHGRTILHCDSAYMFNDSNVVKAYGHIHIIQNDSIHLYGDKLTYYGDENLAKIRENVRANKDSTWLYTEFLDYNREIDQAYYFNGGRVVNNESVLVSKNGYYYPQTDNVYFKNDVVGTSPTYTMYSDTAIYNNKTEIVTIVGPTTIINCDSVIIDSESGWYNTVTDEAKLLKNNSIWSGEHHLVGDTIFYQRHEGLGTTWGNMELTDTIQRAVLCGDYGFYNEITGESLATIRAVAKQVYQTDTLFLHGDTIQVIPLADTSRLVVAYHKVKFFREDLQGRCDSLVFDFRDSIATMYYFPIVWAQGNQMTADKIKLYTRNMELYQTDLIDAAFVISPEEDDSTGYNQVKGKLMNGHIRNNELYLIDVSGNGQTLYYPKDGNNIIGINRAECSNMSIWLKENHVQSITMRVQPTGNMNPPFLLGEEDLRLAGFRWLDDYRPKSKEDIFLLLEIPEELMVREEVYEGYTFDDIEEE